MFVPRARVQIGNPGVRRGWFSSTYKRRHYVRYNLKWYECIRMPCLLPTLISIIIGTLVILSGALMSFVGYNPQVFSASREINEDIVERNISTNDTSRQWSVTDARQSRLKTLTYIGPVFMGIGFFVMMVAAVLYCEIKDKYVTSVLPKKDVKQMKKEALYDMIIEEFRKNYFRGIEVPLRKVSSKTRKKSSENVEKEMPTLMKALSLSQPALLITPDVQRKWQDSRKNTRTPSIKRRRRRFHYFNEPWLKTSSLPNIRSKPSAHIYPTKENKHENKIDHNQSDNKRTAEITDQTLDNQTADTTGFDNPAFRKSPTEKTPRIEISPPTSPESSLTRTVTDAVVHVNSEDDLRRPVIYDNSEDDLKRPVIHDTKGDNRGFTQRRQTGQFKTTIENVSIQDQRRHSIISIEDVTLLTNDDNENYNVNIENKHDLIFDNRQSGPYKTFITMFRSESCLDRIRKFASSKSENDTDSLDSLTLSDDLMRNFEMTVFPPS